ncbi:HemK2/MTQ2 family protein methyltransferase [Phaeacidiphilus oryzae]|uniref:HemK2/MTQ2 family protein methyltransferase n=1 Tax=Phaeacidiphilus oryzae TaxID=348818 RepID=UPI00056B8E80|nr:HemK2/MTQ2 family protein methyltransferase [Phaeacidiphilus oryzae]
MFLIRPPGVYRPGGDTSLLLSSLAAEDLGRGRSVLDVGTGCGPLAVAAACRGARVTAVDVSRRALLAAAFNAALHGRRIAVRRGDLLAPVADRRFDVVVTNPPYVPAIAKRAPRLGARHTWDGGPDGRRLLDRLCAEAPALLARGGVLLVVQSAFAGVEATCAALRAAGLTTSVVARARQPYGPVLRGQATWLERRGMARHGQREEEVVVIRGARTD